MSGALGNLLIKLTADTGEATGDIGKAAHQIERDMQTMAIKATAAGNLIADAVTRIGGAFLRAGEQAIEYGDQLAKMSQRTGFAVERLSEIAFAGKLADVSTSQLTSAFGMLNKAMIDAEKGGSRAQIVFKSLGVDITQGPQVAFEQLSKAVIGLTDQESRITALRAVFGRAGDALLPLILSLEESTQKARELGLTISTKMAQDSERFNDSMSTLKASMGRFTVSVVGEALPSLTKFIDQMTEGTRIAGGFGQAIITLGTINPFKTVSGNIKSIGDEIKSLEEARARYQASNADTSAIDQSLVRLRQQYEFLKFQQRADALALGGSDTAGERARMGLTAKGNTLKGLFGDEDSSKATKTKSDAAWMASQYKRMAEERAKEAVEAAEANNKASDALEERARLEYKWGQEFTNMTLQEIQEWEKRKFAGIDAMIEIADANTLMANGFEANGKKIGESTKKNSEWARELGLSFNSAFEDAIIAGKKFSDVLRGIGQDILRMVARETVTMPLAGMVGKGLEGLMSFIPSFDVGTDYVPQDTLAMVHKGEAIIPASQNSGNRGGTYYIDARGADRSGMDNLLAYIRSVDGSIEQRAVSAVSDTRRRGGSFARSMG